MLNPIMDSRTKVIYAALYLDNEADFRYQTIQAEYPGMGWEAFTKLLLRQFSTGNHSNLIGKFNKVTQTGTVDVYVAEFEELRGYLMSTYALHMDEFYLSSFINGLRSDIQYTSINPTSCRKPLTNPGNKSVLLKFLRNA